MNRVAIVGASGFVGSTLVERMIASGTHEVVPFIHSSGNAWRIARLGIGLVQLDLLDAHRVESELQGITHVVNCSRGGNDVMLQGLRNLLTASRKQGVQRFIHIGSVAVYGDPPPFESSRESAPTLPAAGSYGWMKLRQDDLVTRACREGLPSLIVCPPNISGPHSDYLVGIVDALRSGGFALLEDGSAPINLVDVANLCHAIELALANGAADGARVFVTDNEDTTWRNVVEHLIPLARLNRPVPVISREELSAMPSDPEMLRGSLLKSIKHLVSSDVRQALRKDPWWANVDAVLRKGVARMGTSVEGKLRLSVEGPKIIEKAVPAASFDVRLCRQQLRGVRHSCETAKKTLAYRPRYSFTESMGAFGAWYRYHLGMDSLVWPMLEHLHVR